MTNVLDEHILFCPDGCESLGAVALQAKDDSGSSDGRSHEGVVVAQVGFTVELVASVADEAQID